MMTSMHTLKAHLATVESEVLALNSGLKSAGPRARKALQSLKDSAHSMRAEVVTFQKDLPVKKRVNTKSELTETEEPLPEPPVLERQDADPIDVVGEAVDAMTVDASAVPEKKKRSTRKNKVVTE